MHTKFVVEMIFPIILFILLLVHCSGKRVLIVGATGRVGQTVTKLLAAESKYNLNILVRNLTEETKSKFSDCPSLSFFEGDVSNRNVLLQATAGCDAVIDVHGMKPPRFTKLIDFVRHPKHDPTHPYNGLSIFVITL